MDGTHSQPIENAPVDEKLPAHIAQIPLTTPRAYTQALLAEVAREHGVTVADLMFRARAPRGAKERGLRRVSHARWDAMRRLLAAKPYWSIAEVGRYFGMDHSSVLHALDQTGGGRLGRKAGGRKARYGEAAP